MLNTYYAHAQGCFGWKSLLGGEMSCLTEVQVLFTFIFCTLGYV